MIDDIEKIIRIYLPEVIHLSLATSVNNMPWVCEVHYVYDDALNLYFRSTPARRHSQEIAKNSHVAGTIMKQHAINELPQGVYFEGEAHMLTNVKATDEAYIQYCKRFGTGPEILEEAKNSDGHRFYKISVSKYYLFDRKESNPGKKYELPWH